MANNRVGLRCRQCHADGIDDSPPPWDEFDVLFMGGSTAFKLSERAYELVREAKSRGKRAHQGRVNSLRRLRAAVQGGYDSADGTFIAFGGPCSRFREELAWLVEVAEGQSYVAARLAVLGLDAYTLEATA